MTQVLDIANRAFQLAQTRTNMTEAEFTTVGPNGLLGTSNEAQQANLVIYEFRDQLLRMAPWDCCTKYANLTYISSMPTTPENSTTGPPMWQPGMPAPPYAYEYQYPVDCMRARKIIPQYTALAGNVPIYPSGIATSGGGWMNNYTGPALKFKVSTDSFFSATALTVTNGGTGYNAGDLIFLQQPTFTFTQFYPPLTNQISPQSFTMNVGAPAVVQVLTVNGSGTILTATLVNQVFGEDTSPSGAPTFILSGSYFGGLVNPVPQGFAVGSNGQQSGGTGATFTLSTTGPIKQRVILCNQENAILEYNCLITDPNVMDKQFQEAWVAVLGARLANQLNGDKALANALLAEANQLILEARKSDGNEGITVNDVMPDFLRIRGNFGGPNWEYSPNMSFDWGGFYSPY